MADELLLIFLILKNCKDGCGNVHDLLVFSCNKFVQQMLDIVEMALWVHDIDLLIRKVVMMEEQKMVMDVQVVVSMNVPSVPLR